MLDKILKKSMRNRLSLVQDISREYDGIMEEYEKINLVRHKSVVDISCSISKRLDFEQEISSENSLRFYSSIYIFNLNELLELIKFIIGEKDA